MIQIIEKILDKWLQDIRTDNTNITEEEQFKILTLLGSIADKDEKMSKIQACDYLRKSRSTFDKLVSDGFIHQGRKQEGFKELFWSKVDLDLYKLKYEPKE